MTAGERIAAIAADRDAWVEKCGAMEKCAFQSQEMAKEIAAQLDAAVKALRMCSVAMDTLLNADWRAAKLATTAILAKHPE